MSASVIALAKMRALTVCTAESCTGGLIAAALTSVPGSSSVVQGGIVAYANAVKTDVLDVDPVLIERHGAVSSHVAEAMARGGRLSVGADICVSVTGIAGPGGARPDKPVGTVYIGIATANICESFHHLFADCDREGVRRKTVIAALGHLHDVIETETGRVG